MRKDRKPNKVGRRMAVVFSDPWHTIHLVEVKGDVRWVVDEHGETPMINMELVEATARQHMVNRGLPKPVLGDQPHWDVVGVLVATTGALTAGRILWAKDNGEGVSLSDDPEVREKQINALARAGVPIR